MSNTENTSVSTESVGCNFSNIYENSTTNNEVKREKRKLVDSIDDEERIKHIDHLFEYYKSIMDDDCADNTFIEEYKSYSRKNNFYYIGDNYRSFHNILYDVILKVVELKCDGKPITDFYEHNYTVENIIEKLRLNGTNEVKDKYLEKHFLHLNIKDFEILLKTVNYYYYLRMNILPNIHLNNKNSITFLPLLAKFVLGRNITFHPTGGQFSKVSSLIKGVYLVLSSSEPNRILNPKNFKNNKQQNINLNLNINNYNINFNNNNSSINNYNNININNNNSSINNINFIENNNKNIFHGISLLSDVAKTIIHLNNDMSSSPLKKIKSI